MFNIRLLGLCSAMLSLSAVGSAQATCGKISGVWWFYAMQGSTPGIHTVPQQVVVDPQGNTKNITVFGPSHPYGNGPISVLTCRVSVNAEGVPSGGCTSYEANLKLVQRNESITGGALNLDSFCSLSGAIQINSDPVNVSLMGHVNGNIGAGIALHGNLVHHFTLVRN